MLYRTVTRGTAQGGFRTTITAPADQSCQDVDDARDSNSIKIFTYYISETGLEGCPVKALRSQMN